MPLSSIIRCTPTPLFIATALIAAPCSAAITLLDVDTPTGKTTVSIGGYAKADMRYVDGDIAYQDYWVANLPGGEATDTSRTGFNIRESRLNFKVAHGEAFAFVELDFYGGGGNEVVSNSSNPRMRHYFINYKNWLFGQTWSTFMSTYAIPEAMDFGGPHVGEVFIRQTQLRYTNGPFQFAIENPETNGDGDIGNPASAVGLTGDQADPDESIPDLVAKYTFKGDWGQITAAGLVRKIDQGGLDDTATAINIAGKFAIGEKDDFRFQITTGDPGRYVAAGLTGDIALNANGDLEVESTDAIALGYRHFWTQKTRSTIYYGRAETDISERDRSHWAVNLVTELQPKLTAGIELGQYAIDDENLEAIDSNYLQFSAQFAF